MEGFDYNKAKEELAIPEVFEVCAMVAVGKRGKKDELPLKYQTMEEPSNRKALNEIVFEGMFKGK